MLFFIQLNPPQLRIKMRTDREQQKPMSLQRWNTLLLIFLKKKQNVIEYYICLLNLAIQMPWKFSFFRAEDIYKDSSTIKDSYLPIIKST